jgi:hypothetical protein
VLVTVLAATTRSLLLARSRSDRFFTVKDYPQVLALLSEMLKLMAASMANAQTGKS